MMFAFVLLSVAKSTVVDTGRACAVHVRLCKLASLAAFQTPRRDVHLSIRQTRFQSFVWPPFRTIQAAPAPPNSWKEIRDITKKMGWAMGVTQNFSLTTAVYLNCPLRFKSYC